MTPETPEEKVAWVMFFIIVCVMIAYGVLCNHFKAFAHDTINETEQQELFGNKNSDDPLECLDEVIIDEEAKIKKEKRTKLELLLYRRVMNQLMMCRQKSDGKIIFHKFCREDKPQCEENIRLYVNYIAKYADEFEISPWLLTAVALHESNFDAYVEGSRGEKTIFQLLPYSAHGRKSRFVQEPKYRKYCKNIPGHCQETATGIAANLLKENIKHCRSIKGGLSAYNTGKCYPIYKRYVSGIGKKMRTLKKNIVNVKWCSGEDIKN